MFPKRFVIWLFSVQMAIVIFSLVFYKEINLLSYTNVSFIIGILLLLYSLAGFVIRGRFFDIAFYGFQSFFGRRQDKDRDRLSELVPSTYGIPFLTSLFTLLLMGAALFLHLRG